MSNWYVVTSLNAISAGPKAWNRSALSAELAALNVNVRVQQAEPASALGITDPVSEETAFLLPQRVVEPATVEAWEELTGPVEMVVPGVEVTATYGKQDRSKPADYEAQVRAS